jgi:osmoprotectant transport system permease protein
VPSALFASYFVEAFQKTKDFWPETFVFLSLVARGLGLGLLLSLPLGVFLTRCPRWVAGPVIYFLGMFQTIPGLALLAFCVSVLQIIGGSVAVFTAVIYGLFPVVLSTYTGIKEDRRLAALSDAARGMGMTDWQVLWRIELPLALPAILAGVRTAALYAVGLVTLSAIVGAGGLGAYITAGMSRGDGGQILVGVLPVLCITLVLFVGLDALAWLAKERSDLGLRLGAVGILLLALYGLGVPLVGLLAPPPASDTEVNRSNEPEVARFTDEEPSPSLWQTWAAEGGFWGQFFHFVSMALRGLGLAMLLGLPLGVLLTRQRHLAKPLIAALALVQNVPSLALLGLLVSLSGMVVLGLTVPPLFGIRAAILVTVVYSLFPIVLHTYTGITEVAPGPVDAARGMGMTDLQVLRKVELPLALPMIMAGVKTAATFAVSMVTIGAMVGARGLGDYILEGMATEQSTLVLLGVLPILLLTLVLFGAFSGLEWLVKHSPTVGRTRSYGLVLLASGYALTDPLFRPQPDVRIGSKDFMENRLLAEMTRLLIEHDHPELKVELSPNLGSSFAYQSLRAGVLDLYPEYTGTLLTAQDALGVAKVPLTRETLAGFALKEVEVDRLLRLQETDRAEAVTQLVRQVLAARTPALALLRPFGLNNTFAVVVQKSLGLKSIGDLKPSYRIAVPAEFLERADGWEGLLAAYELHFDARPQQMGVGYLYKALRANQADAVVGFSTDWQIAFFAPPLVALKDDRKYFPTYNAAPLVRQAVLDRHPGLAATLEKLGGRVDDDAIRYLIRQVVVAKRRPAAVAREFLTKEGLLPPQ